jgi:hypothetical protein
MTECSIDQPIKIHDTTLVVAPSRPCTVGHQTDVRASSTRTNREPDRSATIPWMQGVHRGRRRRAKRLGAIICLPPLLAGCASSGLAFRQDHRLEFTDLQDRDTISLPYTLEFTFDGPMPEPATAFAVLVDWTPPPPGSTLAGLFDDDAACSGPLGCPDGYLERNRIHVITEHSLIITDVPATSGSRADFHEVTIILVDDAGHRVGETSAFARFQVDDDR